MEMVDPMTLDSSLSELTSVVVRVRELMLSDHDAQAAVVKLAQAADLLIDTGLGAGVLLLDDSGRRRSAATTDHVAEAADTAQHQLGEGPCLTAWAKQEVQRLDDTMDDDRWSRWRATAVELGIRSVLSIPLAYRGRALGALQVYARAPAAFGDAEEKLLGLLADAASTLLGAAQPVDAPVRLSASLQSALESRDTITLATGFLMAQEDLDAVAAKAWLIEEARVQGRRMVQVAADVLDRGRTARG